MSRPRYPWKRFWYPRSADFRLSDGGYLSDPEGEHGRILNPDAVASADLGGIPCLILLGEQGIGKSTVIRESNAQLTFDLGSYASDISITQDVFLNPRVVAWLRGTETLTLSLDGLDEGRGAIDNIVKVLLRELRKIQPHAHRLLLRIGCRTADWPCTLEDELRDIWGENAVSVYQLAPLRRADVRVAAEAYGIDARTFFNEVDRREAVPFAIKPITLQFLLACFKRDMRFPASRTALYLDGCRGLCEESDERRDAGFAGDLSADQRVGIAARIAALTMFGGFSEVWNGADRGNVPEGDISIRQLCGGAERIQGIDISIDEHAVGEVLRTGLFSARGQNELGWSHYSYSEFLAARYLADRNVTTSQAMSLLSLPDDREGKLAPQLHETAAWLASMRPEFFRIIMEADPGVLLLSDVATADPADRANLVGTLLRLYDEERLLDSDWGRHALYRKLAHPGLAGQLQPYIVDAAKGPVVRRVAIDIAEACELHNLQTHLADVALDAAQDLSTRVQAAYALTRIGDSTTRARLKPLAIVARTEDVQDELKGCALQALWPHALTGDEMFSSLTPRKVESYGGAYCQFLVSTLPKGIQKSHVPAALKWLSRQRTRRALETCFEKVSDLVMKLAWDNLFDEDIIEAFVDVVAMRLRSHDGIFGNYREASENVFPSDDGKRRLVVERLLPHLTDGELRFIQWSICGTGRGKDFLWILERYQSCADDALKGAWLKLVVGLFRPVDQVHLEAILTASASDAELAQAVSPMIAPVELGSPESIALKKAYEESERLESEMEDIGMRPLLTPTPAERIVHFLDRFEKGEMDAWWRLHVQMTLEPNSTHYGDDREADLTAMPGWKASGIEVRQRILSAAKKYLLEAASRDEEWLGKDVWFRSAMAGYTACLLLLQDDPDSLRAFDGAIWKKWAPALLAYSTSFTGGGRDLSPLNQELLALASSSARPEILQTLLTLIDYENETSEYLGVTEKLADCWDEELANTLFAKCRDQRLKPVFVGALLELLLQRGHAPARSLAASFVPTPVPAEGTARTMAIAASAAILRNLWNGGWAIIWPAFCAEADFGKEVIAAADLPGRLDLNGYSITNHLDDGQLADFYIWLFRTFPEVQPQEQTAWLGTSDRSSLWRNGILHQLSARGTETACEAIIRIGRELPGHDFLKWTLQKARETTRLRNWKPTKPEHILRMAADSTKRLVRGGDELLVVVLESLERLSTKLRGETPLAANLWNEVSPRVWEPKDEEHLSDNIKQYLEDDLRAKGVVLNREVVIRRNRGETKGERTDIHVDAVIPGATSDVLDVVTVIIEAKGCWNSTLWTAMKSQLVDRYLLQSRTRHGLYLVGWFNCVQWSRDDTRKPPNMTPLEAQKRLDVQATDLSSGTLVIKAVVLDTSLR